MSTIVLYLIAIILRIEGDASTSAPIEATAEVADKTIETDVIVREPEDQTPTGKWTTASEVKPILQMTKPQWVGVRNYDGRDLVYFTNLVAMRCALWDIHYGLNGAAADILLPMEPCHLDYAAPNVMIEIEDYLPYIEAPSESVETVTVKITFDDGTMDEATYARNDVLIP